MRPNPAAKMSARAGNYRADIDTAGVDDAMLHTLQGKPQNAVQKAVTKQGPNIVARARQAVSGMRQGIGRLMGNRPDTEAEETSHKRRGQKAYYDAKLSKDFQK